MHVNGVAVVGSNGCLDVFARCISIVRGYYSRILTKFPLRQQTEEVFRCGAVPCVFNVIFWLSHTVWGWLNQFWSLDTPGTAPDNHFRSAVTTVKNLWKRLAQHRTVRILRKTTTDAPGKALNTTTCYEPPRGKRSKTTVSASPDLIVWHLNMLMPLYRLSMF